MLNIVSSVLNSGTAAVVANSYESIATTTVGLGGVSSVTFSSIPATYTHLQLRAMYGTATLNSYLQIATSGGANTGVRGHMLHGNGATATGLNYTAGATGLYLDYYAPSGVTPFYATVIDFLDYTNTNKYKTVRALSGGDWNGSGEVDMSSFLFDTTNAITSITISGGATRQYSSFALYGIKG
jgi:hypothetical protein